jgi:hypothetical protein
MPLGWRRAAALISLREFGQEERTMNAGGAKPGADREYQSEIREAAWKAILRSVTDPDTRRSDIREDDIVEALTDLLAIVVSSTEAARSTIALRDRVEVISKKLRTRAGDAVVKEEGKELFKNVTRERS